jgi:hypothetical protein
MVAAQVGPGTIEQIQQHTAIARGYMVVDFQPTNLFLKLTIASTLRRMATWQHCPILIVIGQHKCNRLHQVTNKAATENKYTQHATSAVPNNLRIWHPGALCLIDQTKGDPPSPSPVTNKSQF